MLTFKQYLLESGMNTKYICAVYDDPTQVKLRAWCKKNGFNLAMNHDEEVQDESKFVFHSTIFFSTTKHDIPNAITPVAPKDVRGLELKMLGKDSNIPVLKISGNPLRDVRNYYINTYNMKDEWPTYQPHISLSYDRKQMLDITNMSVPDFTLTYDKIKVTDAKS